MQLVKINELIQIAHKAGEIVLQVYNQACITVTEKLDKSVLTEADLQSHEFICAALKKAYPEIPIISEESVTQLDYAERQQWDYFFLVDPLDGTKEFIQRNGEFTINIALIEKNYPILGVVHAPAKKVTYYAEKNKGAYKIFNAESVKLPLASQSDGKVRVVMSRSHACSQTQQFVNELQSQGKEVVAASAGSALKFGLVAEGSADIYPRFVPTMEWDTAAGQLLVSEIGKKVTRLDTGELLDYNKQVLTNPGFIVQ